MSFDPTNTRPIRNGVLIQADPPERKVGSIFVPDSAARHSGCIGTVLATGTEVEYVCAGMRVAFASIYKGDVAPRFEHEGSHFYVVPEEQIHGIIEET